MLTSRSSSNGSNSLETTQNRLEKKFDAVYKLHCSFYSSVWEITPKENPQERWIIKSLPTEPKYGIDGDILREIDAMKRCRHTNIVQLNAIFHGETYIDLRIPKFDYDLSMFIQANGWDDVRRAQFPTLVQQLTNAIQFIHSNGIHHMDIKPRNIFVRSSGDDDFVFVLGDFGLCSNNNQDTHSVDLCTMNYKSPELLLRCLVEKNIVKTHSFVTFSNLLRNYDPENPLYWDRYDIWSLGCTLLEYVCRVPVFNCANDANKTLALIKIHFKLSNTRLGESRLFEHVNKRVPAWIRLIYKSMAIHPYNRADASTCCKMVTKIMSEKKQDRPSIISDTKSTEFLSKSVSINLTERDFISSNQNENPNSLVRISSDPENLKKNEQWIQPDEQRHLRKGSLNPNMTKKRTSSKFSQSKSFDLKYDKDETKNFLKGEENIFENNKSFHLDDLADNLSPLESDSSPSLEYFLNVKEDETDLHTDDIPLDSPVTRDDISLCTYIVSNFGINWSILAPTFYQLFMKSKPLLDSEPRNVIIATCLFLSIKFSYYNVPDRKTILCYIDKIYKDCKTDIKYLWQIERQILLQTKYIVGME